MICDVAEGNSDTAEEVPFYVHTIIRRLLEADFEWLVRNVAAIRHIITQEWEQNVEQ